MKDANWPYLAAMIDGEGHIGITKGCRYWTNKDGVKTKYPAYCLQISVANNSMKLMRYLISHFGGVYYVHTRKNPNACEGYIWQPKGIKNKEHLLLAILPYLVIKAEQANLALQFIRMEGEINPEKRHALYERFLQLNRRGVSPTTNMSDDPVVQMVQEHLDAPSPLLQIPGSKIESELHGDMQSAPVVTPVA